MDAYTGKYFIQDDDPQEATVLLLKDKISIGIREENGNPRVIYWFYDQVIRDNFWKRGQAIVRYGSYPVQVLEVDSQEFADKLENIFQHKEKSWLSRTFSSNRMRMIKILGVLFSVLVLSYFFLVPFLSERLAMQVPVSYEEELGDGLYEALKSGFELDEEKTAYINDFFREMKIPTEYNIRISVVKEDIANAFAMPGGHIVVYDKILAGMNDYEDLAALLSHEFTHIHERHTTRSLFRQLGSAVFLSFIFGDVSGVASLVIRNADQLKGLNYSRKLEKEADLNGLKILSERKIDCKGFIRLFEIIKKEAFSETDQPAEWISSHPDLDNRMDYIQKDEWFNKNGTEKNELLKTIFLKIKTGD
jgi:beta-barrel assembly-enhancing protease